MVKLFIGVLVALVAVIVVFTAIDPNVSTNANNIGTVINDDVSNANTLTVTISGQVNKPGTYVLEDNSTLGTLIDLASDVTSNADELAYTTTFVLSDGGSYYIAPKYDTTDVCTTEPIEKVDINHDDEVTLQEISGIGSSIAASIVSYRNENGDFECIEELKDVTGIGGATFTKIRDFVTLRSN